MPITVLWYMDAVLDSAVLIYICITSRDLKNAQTANYIKIIRMQIS